MEKQFEIGMKEVAVEWTMCPGKRGFRFVIDLAFCLIAEVPNGRCRPDDRMGSHHHSPSELQ